MGVSQSCCTGGDSLYERLGGLAAIEAIVEGLFDRIDKDDRINYVFFGANLPTLKARYKKYLGHAFGGPTWVPRDLRDAHCQANRGESVTGTQYGAVLELAIDAMLELGIGMTIVEEVTYELLSVYGDILNKDVSLFARVGGLTVISALVRDCFNFCASHDLFRHPRFHNALDSEYVRSQVAKYLAAILFGGSREVVYRGPGFKIFDGEFVTYDQCAVVREAFSAAMIKFGVPRAETAEIKGILIAIEQLIADR